MCCNAMQCNAMLRNAKQRCYEIKTKKKKKIDIRADLSDELAEMHGVEGRWRQAGFWRLCRCMLDKGSVPFYR